MFIVFNHHFQPCPFISHVFFWERPSPCWKWIIISLSKSQAASLWNQGRNPVVPGPVHFQDPMDPMESMDSMQSCGARWWTPNPTSAVVLPVFGAALTSTQTIGRSVVYGDRTSGYGMGKQWSGRFWYPTNWVSRIYFGFSTKRWIWYLNISKFVHLFGNFTMFLKGKIIVKKSMKRPWGVSDSCYAHCWWCMANGMISSLSTMASDCTSSAPSSSAGPPTSHSGQVPPRWPRPRGWNWMKLV